MVVLRYGHCRSADKIEKTEKILEYNQNEKISVVLNLQTTEIESKRRQALQYRSIVEKYVEMDAAHPFMEGNGRNTRIWLDLILKKNLKRCVDRSRIDKSDYPEALRESVDSPDKIMQLLKNALTDDINNREIIMKGIDYSYYYETEE